MAADRLFLDTNILVYASRASSSRHGECIRLLQQEEQRAVPPVVSRQVLREYLAVTTRQQPGMVAISGAEAIADVRFFIERFEVVPDGPDVTERLLELVSKVRVAGAQIHDANIVATMLVHGIGRLATCNMTDFARFRPLIQVVTP